MRSRPVLPATGPLDAAVTVPGSKSLANRALVCAGLAEGPSELRNVPGGDDTVAMVECLHRLGITVAVARGRATVHGTGGQLPVGPITLPARLAGTTSRFVTALAALGPGPYVVDGEAPLRRRPMGELHDALSALGAVVTPGEIAGHLPVTVSAGTLLTGSSVPSAVDMRGDVSSQYVSALMMVGPYLPEGLRIHLTSPLVSRPYVEMTRSVMAAFGHAGVTVGPTEITVAAGCYTPASFTIEPDATSAAYPLAAAAIVGGCVRVPGYRAATSVQGDRGFVEVLRSMGCDVRSDDGGTEVRRSGALTGVEVDLADMSDCAPTLAVVAAVASSPSRVTGIGFIHAKESDRIGDVVRELERCGVDAVAEEDGFVVRPGARHGASIRTYDDHRIAMSFALLGLVTPGVVIEEPAVVRKSFPSFWRMLERLTK